VIGSVLTQLHNRNTRLQLFPEEIFVAPKSAELFPFGTHTLKFEDFVSEHVFQRVSERSDESQLLHVLTWYPFSIPFSDRVRVWNQLLNNDKDENDPNRMLYREEIQIRRNYIYEDAYKKLSRQNGKDTKSSIQM